MSENEIVKHVEAAYKALKNPQTRWLHKLQEVLVEIVIIVFAVTLSIWLHNWSDSIHQHREELEYLTGLRQDIRADLLSADSDRAFYVQRLADLNYFQSVGAGQPLNADSLRVHLPLFFSNTDLEPHISRYEALKSSGKMAIIENTDLVNNIITLHEEAIKHVEALETMYSDYTNRMGRFVQEHGKMGPNGAITNAQDVLRMSEMRFLIVYGTLIVPTQMMKVHDTCIAQCQRVIAQIDGELKKG